MRVRTESGSWYQFDGLGRVRRLADRTLRRDGEWLRLQAHPHVQTGVPMVLVLEPLGDGNATIRTTSRVLEVWA